MVSILMPAKNAAEFLDECISSILNQTYEKWELCVVDDHSTDNTLEILNQFALNDSRIRVFTNKGTGIINALTLAFNRSQGEFISRMDADDLMANNKIELLRNALLKRPNHIITNKVKYFSKTKLNEGYSNYEQWLNALVDQQNHYQEIYKECVIPSPSWMLERHILEGLGGFKSLDYPEDYDLCFKLYQQNVPVYGLRETLHFWRDYPDRTSRTNENYADNRFLELKVRYFIECDFKNDEELVLWGAGKKGKRIAQLLKDSNIPFRWVTNNESKLKAPIYDNHLERESILEELNESQIILAIAQKGFNLNKVDYKHAVFKFC